MAKQMFPAPDVHTFLERVDRRVGLANTVQVEGSAELRSFEGLNPEQVRAAAARHNLLVVYRMGGEQLDFTRLAKF